MPLRSGIQLLFGDGRRALVTKALSNTADKTGENRQSLLRLAGRKAVLYDAFLPLRGLATKACEQLTGGEAGGVLFGRDRLGAQRAGWGLLFCPHLQPPSGCRQEWGGCPNSPGIASADKPLALSFSLKTSAHAFWMRSKRCPFQALGRRLMAP